MNLMVNLGLMIILNLDGRMGDIAVNVPAITKCRFTKLLNVDLESADINPFLSKRSLLDE